MRFQRIRQAYRSLYTMVGGALNSFASQALVDALKRVVPHPSSVPRHLREVAFNSRAVEVDRSTIVRFGAGDVIVFSMIPWGFRHQRPQYIAEFLGRRRRVFYIDMAPATGRERIVRVADNVYSVQFARDDVGYVRPYVGRWTPGALSSWMAALHRFRRDVGMASNAVTIVQHPFWWPLVSQLGAKATIVDIMDHIGGFSNAPANVDLLEAEMVRQSQLAIVTSAYLHRKFAPHGQVEIVRNGVQPERFRGFPPAGANPRPTLGYVGAVSEWFDFDLFRSWALACPDADFHVWGGVSTPEVRKFTGLNNVHLHGEIPHTEVPAALASIDVGLIPFRLTPLIEACDPIKFYEYCAAEKPTISTKLPELLRVRDLLFFASSADEFKAALAGALRAANERTLSARLADFVQHNTWESRADIYSARIEALLS